MGECTELKRGSITIYNVREKDVLEQLPSDFDTKPDEGRKHGG